MRFSPTRGPSKTAVRKALLGRRMANAILWDLLGSSAVFPAAVTFQGEAWRIVGNPWTDRGARLFSRRPGTDGYRRVLVSDRDGFLYERKTTVRTTDDGGRVECLSDPVVAGECLEIEWAR